MATMQTEQEKVGKLLQMAADVKSKTTMATMQTDHEELDLCQECCDIVADCRCIKCDCIFCNECFDKVHNQFKSTRSHAKEPLSVISVPTSPAMMCPYHKDQLVQYYCITDECAICAHCAVVGRHKGHEISTIEEQEIQLLAIKEKAKELLSNCEQSTEVLKQMISMCEVERTGCVIQIVQHFDLLADELVNALCDRKVKLIDDVNKAYGLNHEYLSGLVASVNDHSGKLQPIVLGDIESASSTSTVLAQCPSGVVKCIRPFTVSCGFDRESLLHSIANYGGVNFTTDVVAGLDESVEPVVNQLADNLHTASTSNKQTAVAATKTEREACSVGADKEDRKASVRHSLLTEADANVKKLGISSTLPDSIANFMNGYKGNGSFSQLVASNKLGCNGDGVAATAGASNFHVPEGLPSSEDIRKPACPLFAVAQDGKNVNSNQPTVLITTGLSECDKKVVCDLWPQLCDCLDIDEKLLTVMRTKDLLTPMEMMKLALPNESSQKKMFEIQDKILRSPKPDALHLFIDAVRESGQEEIAAWLSESLKKYQGSDWAKVRLTHIRNPSHFTVQYEHEMPTLHAVMKLIDEQCNKQLVAPDVKQVEPGMQVLAKYNVGGQWCRANVLQVVPDKGIEVHFYDYGNTDFVSSDGIRLANKDVFKLPSIGLLCALDRVEPLAEASWSESTVKAFAHMISNKSMLMKVCRKTAHHVVFVELAWCPPVENVIIPECRYELVSDALGFHQLAKLLTESDIPKLWSTRYREPQLPKPGQVFSAAVTFPCGDRVAAVQQSSSPEALTTLMADLKALYDSEAVANSYALHVPWKGLPCVAQYSADSEWYRAEIIDIGPNGIIRVRYVDYGNEEVLTVDHLRKIAVCFMDLPKQAVFCKLTGDSASWIDLMSQTEEPDQVLYLMVTGVTEERTGPVLLVSSEDIYNNSAKQLPSSSKSGQSGTNTPIQDSLNQRRSPPKTVHSPKQLRGPPSSRDNVSKANAEVQRLATDVVARSKTPVEYGKSSLVYISHVVSPGEFYFHVLSSSAKKELDKLMSELANTYEDSVLLAGVKWTKAQDCVVRRPSDGRWYRAQILDVSETTPIAKVLLHDFGYRESVDLSALRVVGSQFQMAPMFAARCHLVGISPASGSSRWQSDACKYLIETIQCKEVHVNFKGRQENGSFAVDVVLEMSQTGDALSPDRVLKVSVADLLVEKKFALRTQGQAPGMEMPVDEPKGAVRDPSVAEPARPTFGSFKPARPPASKDLTATVTHVDDDCNIYVQEISRDQETFLENVLIKMKKQYENSSPQRTVTWRKGCPVAAKFADDNEYYRAQIVDFKDGIEVFFVDYGNTELVTKEDLRTLDAKFLEIPVNCFKCQLHEILPPNQSSWSTKARDIITDLTQNKKCSLHIKYVTDDGTLQVDLKLEDGTSVRDMLIKMNLAVRSKQSAGGRSLDSALIRSAPEENTASSDFSAASGGGRPLNPPVVRGAPDEYMASSDFSAASGGGLPFNPPVVRSAPQNTTPFDFEVIASSSAGQRIPDRLVNSPYPPRLVPNIGDRLHVLVTQVDSPSVVYLQHIPTEDAGDPYQTSINNELQQLMALAAVYASDADNYMPMIDEDFRPGAPCMAMYSADGNWYRAEIIDIEYASGSESDLASVRFVDYGSFETVTRDRLRALPPDHLNLPVQAVRCNLYGISPPPDQERCIYAVQQMLQLFNNKELIAIVKVRDSYELEAVSCYDLEITAELYEKSQLNGLGENARPVYQCLINRMLMHFDLSSSSSSVTEATVDVANMEDL